MTDSFFALLPEAIRNFYGRNVGELSALSWEQSHIVIRHSDGRKDHWWVEDTTWTVTQDESSS